MWEGALTLDNKTADRWTASNSKMANPKSGPDIMIY
jgi:hypothetical protein